MRTSVTYHSRKSRPVGAADKNIVVEIPDRCPASARIEKHVVRFPVAVKIGGRQQCPTAGQGWAIGTADKRNSREIPDCRLPRTSIEQRVIEVAVKIKIRHIYYIPAGRKSWAVRGAKGPIADGALEARV